MTESEKEVMQQALEFVEFCWRDVPMNDYAADKRDAIEAVLRAAIAQPEQPAPVRQPLTDDDIEKCVEKVWGSFAEFDEIRMFTRAIEAAHGITTPKETT